MKIKNIILNHFTKKFGRNYILKTKNSLLVLSLFFSLASIIGINKLMNYQTLSIDDFKSSQYTLKNSLIQKEGKNIYSHTGQIALLLKTEEYCGEFFSKNKKLAFLNSIRSEIAIGDTFEVFIKKNDNIKLKNCEAVEIWGLSKNGKNYISLSNSIESNVANYTVWIPLGTFLSIIIMLYSFVGFYTFQKYNLR